MGHYQMDRFQLQHQEGSDLRRRLKEVGLFKFNKLFYWIILI